MEDGIDLPLKLDEQVRDQLKKKGKSPHFWAEKSLYKVQDHLLSVAGPLTCLWADANVSWEDTLLLIQRALVLSLLGNASHSITMKWRKIAWSRVNPKWKSLASENYEGRESNLFAPGTEVVVFYPGAPRFREETRGITGTDRLLLTTNSEARDIFRRSQASDFPRAG